MRLLLLLGVLFVLSGCKKDKLKDEKSFLIGAWNWTKTEHLHDFCSGDPLFTDTLTPISEATTYRMEFSEKGILNFYEEGNLIDDYRVVFSHFEKDGDEYYFLIDLNNEENNRIGASGNQSILVFSKLPYEGNPSCESFANYFEKE